MSAPDFVDSSGGSAQEIARLKSELESARKRIVQLETSRVVMGDTMYHTSLTMRAAIIEAEIGDGTKAGLAWISDWLTTADLMPDLDEAKQRGGARGWFLGKTR